MVDDTELFHQLIITYLGTQRFEIHTAYSGTEALELAHEVEPDLILLDMFLPGVNGDRVCKSLKSDDKTSSIPVIILSSCSKEDTRNKAEASGCDELMFKPIRKDLFLTVVESYLGIKIRRHFRANVRLPGILTLQDKEIATIIHTLSIGGAFVEIDEETASTKSLFGLQFHVPGSKDKIAVKSATIRWKGNIKENGSPGAGIQFLSIPPESTDLISRYLKSTLVKDTHQEYMARSLEL